MDSDFQLVLFHPEAAKLDALRRRIACRDGVVFVRGTVLDAMARIKLDAIFVTPMMAYEFGITPPLAPHKAHVFSMPEDRRAQGLPRLLIAGVSLEAGTAYTPKYLGQVTVKELARSVERYNRGHDVPILRVGAFPSVLGLDGANADDALGTLDRLLLGRERESAQRLHTPHVVTAGTR